MLFPGKNGEPLFQELASCYVEAMKDMEGRKPGPTSILGNIHHSVLQVTRIQVKVIVVFSHEGVY